MEAGYDVTILDNFCNASPKIIPRLEEICQQKISVANVDLCDKERVLQLFRETKFDGVIHYAALKAVGDSVSKPLLYYRNNLTGALNLIDAMEATGCKTLVYSSSACVYKPSEVLIKKMPT